MPTPQALIARRPWIIWAVFVLSAITAVLTFMFRHASKPTLTVPKLVEQIQTRRSDLHVHWSRLGNSYLSRQPLTEEDGAKLVLQPSQADKWTGVVFCSSVNRRQIVMPEEEIAAWGEHGLCADNIMLFGDAEIIREIAPLLSSER